MTDRAAAAWPELSFDTQLALFEPLPAGDPRWPPYSPDALDKARAALDDSRRWLLNGADSLAIRLQYGRGVENTDICNQFGVSLATLVKRARFGQWSRALSVANRRDLSQRVWLAGLARQNRKESADPSLRFSANACADLLAASAWEVVPARPPVWTPLDSSAHETATAMRPNPARDEKQGLLDNPANPDRTHRERVATNLDRLIARLEQQQREKAEQAVRETSVEGENTQECLHSGHIHER